MHVKGFAELLFSSFFRGWWATITGVASILSLVLIPDKVTISKGVFVVLIFCLLTLVFLCASTIYQGWLLYRNRFLIPHLLRLQEMKEPGAKFICLLDNIPAEAQGKIGQLKRSINGVEVPFAVIEFGDRNAQGQVHAAITWISPMHLRDLQSNQFGVNDIVVDTFMTSNSALEWTKSEIEEKTGSRL